MYRLKPDLGEYLVRNSKDMGVPGILNDAEKPYVLRNRKAVGTIHRLFAFGTDAEYLVEFAAKIEAEELEAWASEVDGCWLYHRTELAPPDTPLVMGRALIDPFCTTKEDIDLTECSVQLPSAVDRLTCIGPIAELTRLLALEPGLKECLREPS